jgi:hypothetical protein
MSKRRSLILPACVAGVLLLVVGAIYIIDTASALPSFFPGHQAGSAHHHVKHGIAAILLGAGALILAWFQTGPREHPASARPVV